MKRFFLYLIVILCAGSAFAQKKERISLFYTPERLRIVKQRMKSTPQLANSWNEIERIAVGELKRKSLDRMDYLSLVYLMTGDKKYSDKLKEVLLTSVEAETWSVGEMMERAPAWNSELGMAHKAYLCAIAYDAIYKDLSAAERKKIAQGLKRLALAPLLGDWLLEPSRIHSLNSMGHNWWTACVGMGGILAMSLRNEIPEADAAVKKVCEALPQWFSFAGDVLQRKPKTFDEAGGMYESVNYANFGIQEALLFRLAWMNTHPGDAPVPIPQLENIPAFFAHVSYPRSGTLYSVNFGDSNKTATGDGCLILLYAMGMTDDNILWYLSQVEQGQHREGFPLNTPIGFLYTPDLAHAPLLPAMKTSRLFSDFGWATLRGSWQKDATMLAVKSGYTWNHSHADANSFILYHKGKDILKEAGRCWYKMPEYRNYFFQSEAHNVVLFNGKGQLREQQYYGSPLRGYLHCLLDGGNTKYILADGTGPYADRFSRNFRHFLWIDNVIYMVDDLKTHTMGHFTWLWHPGGEVKKQGGSLVITDEQSSVVVRPLYPRPLAPSDFVHDYPDDLYWETHEAPADGLKGTETYYSFHLPEETNRAKALTAIILKESPEQKELPRMERREGKDWIGLRIHNKGKVTDLYINQLADGRLMHSNSWIEADGWSTDAYMFAVTYPEGGNAADAKDIFMTYGSALRRGNKSYYSSLVKRSFIRSEEKGKQKLVMDCH